VKAIDDDAVRFYVKYGLLPLLDLPGQLYLPMEAARAALAHPS
jgi:hypothetical protein